VKAGTLPATTSSDIPAMKKYLLSIYQPDGEAPEPEVLAPVMEKLSALNEEMKRAGAWVFTGGLHDAGTATVVRYRNDDVLITDGPYIEGKEHVGGFWIIKAPDLDAALEWGRKAAEALTIEWDGSRQSLPIEIRPFQHDAES
jgi:hypothetical protein